MLAPICVDCRCSMQCEKNAQMFNDPAAGVFPSTYWVGDVFACPACGHQIAVGFQKSGMTADEQRAIGRYFSKSIEFVDNAEPATKKIPQPINIIFDGPPSYESGRFVECEDDSGCGIHAGEWIERPDGMWALRITALPVAEAGVKTFE